MTTPPKRLFVAAQEQRVIVEPSIVTTAGVIAQYRARAVSPIERYHRRSQITGRQYLAALNLYRDYALGIAGARVPVDGPGSGEGMPYSDVRLAAIERYQRALCTCGKRLAWIAAAVVVDERFVADLAREQHRNVTELMTLLRVALDHVGDGYRLDDYA